MASAKRLGFSNIGYSLSLDVLAVKLMIKPRVSIDIKYRLNSNVKTSQN